MADRPTRIAIVDEWPWRRGEVCKDTSGHWIVHCPNCACCSVASKHQVEEHPDGTLTFSPSLLCPNCGCHYFVRQSRIEYV